MSKHIGNITVTKDNLHSFPAVDEIYGHLTIEAGAELRLLTLAALLTTAATLQACTPQEHAHSEAIFTALGAPLPAGLAEEPVNETPEIEQVVPDVSPPVIAQDPSEPVFDPLACVTIFRVQTCDEGVLHHLDSNMNWID